MSFHATIIHILITGNSIKEELIFDGLNSPTSHSLQDGVIFSDSLSHCRQTVGFCGAFNAPNRLTPSSLSLSSSGDNFAFMIIFLTTTQTETRVVSSCVQGTVIHVHRLLFWIFIQTIASKL